MNIIELAKQAGFEIDCCSLQWHERIERFAALVRAALAEKPAEQSANPVGAVFQEPVYFEVRCEAHPEWMRVDHEQFEEYTGYGWQGRKLYAAPQPAKPAEQEPFGYFNNPALDGWQDCSPDDEGAIALYEAPQPAKQPLTDAELGQIINANWGVGVWQMARAIEAAHGIGETK